MLFVVATAVVVGLEWWVLASDVRGQASGRLERPRAQLLIVLAPLCLITGAVLALMPVWHSETVRTIGLPLPAASWQRHGENWLDYVGPLTPAFMIVDFLIGGFIPISVASVVRQVLSRRASS